MPTRSRVERLVQYVAAMKLHEYPNAGVLAQATGRFPGVTTKTVYRDVAYLRERLHAPVTYDERHRGYFIDDPDWAFPFAELQAHSLFAILICGRVSTPLLPEHLRRETDEVLHSQLAITAPDDLDGELLRSLVFATGARVLPDAAVFDTVCAAWRERRGLALTYRDANGQCGPRQIDVHSLFLSDGAWYARAWCHRRSGWRSFALHRMSELQLLARRFEHSAAVAEDVQQGRVFDQAMVANVTIRVSPAKARVLAEREWFPGQQLTAQPDGGLCLRYAVAPRDELVYWVMSYCSHLVVTQPPELVAEIVVAARRLLEQHTTKEET